MNYQKLYLLNAPILTAFSEFRFVPLTLPEAQSLVREFADNKLIESAIGHAATAEVLSELLNYKVETNRIEARQQVDEAALVFKIKTRIPEGKVLDRKEIEEIGYEFGLLTRLK
jgi:hypothetical protein